MRKRTKILVGVIAVFLCLSAIWTYRLVWGRPSSLNLFAERVLVEEAMRDPEFLSYLGVVDNTFLDFNSGKLTDISLQKNNDSLSQVQRSLDVLHGYQRERLSSQEKITYDILEIYLQNALKDASFGYGSSLNAFSLSEFTPYPVNQVFGMQSFLPDFMANIHRIVNKKSAKNYIARLSQWDKKFGDLTEELERREKSGVVLPRFLIEKVLNELTQFIGVSPTENLLFSSFQEKIAKIDLPQEEKETLKKRVLFEIETKVYPAYEKLIAYLRTQEGRATSDAGVWKFPNGKDYYVHCLKYHTTTEDSPDEIHAIGLSEVARIQGEMRVQLDLLGYGDLGTIEAMNALGNDPRFLYPETEEGRAQVLSDFRAIFESIQEKLATLFFEFPKGELRVEAVPDFRAEASPMAYYEPGDLAGARPGVFYVNTRNLKNQTKFTMPTLAFHEGLPGHHFQIALAQEIKNLPTFRTIVPFTAYQEGWALYCEQLGFEYGFSADSHSNLGRLQMELMRAVRLVVDTGIHWKRWSREQAIAYMMENTGMNENEVAVEIDRYIVLPGQACSYKIGMMKILQLREAMRERLGVSFDIRRFHQIVLENGAVPLTLLESLLTQH